MTTQAATPIQQQQQRINSLSNPSTIPNAINASPSATDNASLYTHLIHTLIQSLNLILPN